MIIEAPGAKNVSSHDASGIHPESYKAFYKVSIRARTESR